MSLLHLIAFWTAGIFAGSVVAYGVVGTNWFDAFCDHQEIGPGISATDAAEADQTNPERTEIAS